MIEINNLRLRGRRKIDLDPDTEYIESDTFTPAGEKFGMGCWGIN